MFSPSPARPIVQNGQPHPLYLATLDAQEEADAAQAELARARRQLASAEARHRRAVARAAIAVAKWVVTRPVGGERP